MALFPEYMIAVDNPKFPRVYAKWCVDVMTAMFEQAPTYSFIDNIEFWIGTHNKPCAEALRSDLKKMASKYKGTNTDHVVCCYDTTTFLLEEIWHNSRVIMAQKRLNDYQIRVMSAFNFTHSLDTSLLDYQMPDVNLMLITFTHPRDYL